MEKVIKDGVYLFSGISEYQIKDEWTAEREGFYIVLNDVVYAIEYDHDDGYRSYGSIYKVANDKVKFRFAPQRVVVKNTEKKCYECGEDYVGVSIYDADNGKLIFEVGTDYGDAYYPIATFEYHPENFSINQK